ncbi:hypothetical protein BASA81_000689 [Batrachochytrium salamandrivorans]|nr:hypothetical protein BASA81_000689 [Batrachochytrium salamandrivorans]
MLTTTSNDLVGTKHVFSVPQHECELSPVDCLNWELARASKGHLRLARDQEKEITLATSRTRTTPEQSAQDKEDMNTVLQFSLHVNALSQQQLPQLPTLLRQGHRDNAAVQKSLFANRVLKQDYKSLENKPAKLMHGIVLFEHGCMRPSFLEEPSKPVGSDTKIVALYKWNSTSLVWERVEQPLQLLELENTESTGHGHSLFLTGREIHDATVSQFGGRNFRGLFVVTGFD